MTFKTQDIINTIVDSVLEDLAYDRDSDQAESLYQAVDAYLIWDEDIFSVAKDSLIDITVTDGLTVIVSMDQLIDECYRLIHERKAK